ncbi:MAG: hypothetical protein HKP27_00185 [Myxococcales bacterium]|nr:hypothetical protein [Myxococcales bacterium]
MPADSARTRTANPLDAYLAEWDFAEAHRRMIDASIDRVWTAALAVTPREIRTLGPFIALRNLPRRLRGLRRLVTDLPSESAPTERSLLQTFVAEGFVPLRLPDVPASGEAALVLGAVGRFWSPAHNQPVRFDDAEAFAEFVEPGFAKVVISLEARERSGAVEVSTETRIACTDAAARRRFAPYWALIRGPSGLIRRSWLAAIERRSRL